MMVDLVTSSSIHQNTPIAAIARLVHGGSVAIISWFEFLYVQNFKAQLGFDTAKDHVLIHAPGNREVTTGPVLITHAIGVGCLPEGFIVKRFQPVFKVGLIFKLLHGFIVSHWRFQAEEKASKASTCGFESLDAAPIQGASL